MRRLSFILLFVIFAFAVFADITPQWLGTYGGSGNDEAQASCYDTGGNYYLAGSFQGSFSAGSYSLSSTHQAVFIIKFSPTGEVLWAICNNTSAAASRTAGVSGIMVDSTGNIYLAGFYSGVIKFATTTLQSAGLDDIFLAKFNASGGYLWAVSLGGSATDRSTGICASNEGYPVIAGYYGSAINTIPHQGSSDILVAKYDADANLVDINHWGGSLLDNAQGIAAFAAGGYVISGCYTGEISFGPFILNAGGKEAYICKLNNDLEPIWAIGSSGADDQECTSIATNDAGIFILGKYSQAFSLGDFSLPDTGSSLFFAKVNADGDVLNLSRLGSCSTSTTFFRSAVVNSLGEMIAAGSLVGDYSHAGGVIQSAGLSDALVCKVDSNGVLSWVSRFGGTGYDNALSISTHNGQSYLLGGFFSSGTAFDEQIPPNNGQKDIFGLRFGDGSGDLPAVPENITLQINGNQSLLTWDAVTTSVNGNPLTISGYHIYYSENPDEEQYELLDSTTGTSYLLSAQDLLPHLRFYKISAYLNPE